LVREKMISLEFGGAACSKLQTTGAWLPSAKPARLVAAPDCRYLALELQRPRR